MFRNIIGVSMALLLVVFAMGWILGDGAGPWVRSVKNSAREQLEELIGEYRVKHEKAKGAVEEAAKRVESVNESVANERIAMRTLDRNIAAAEEEIGTAKAVLAGFERRLSAKQPIVLVSGRRLDDADVRGRVIDLANKIGIANEKVSFLTNLRDRRQPRLAKLEQLRVQAPAELRKLQQSLDFLEAKLAMYEDMKVWVEDDAQAELAVNGMFGQAQDALEEAHQAVDKKLAKFEAIVDATLDSADLAPMEGVVETTSDDLVADIRQILAEDIVRLQ